MATLTGKITDVTSRPPDSISSITVKAPSARIGGGTDVIVSSPADVDFNRTTGDITITGITDGLSWLYIEGDGWSDSIPLAVAEGMITLVEAIANAAGTPGLVDFIELLVALQERIDNIAQDAVDEAAEEIKFHRGNVPGSYTLDSLTPGAWGVASGTVATNLGMPEAVTGTITVTNGNTTGLKTAFFISSTHATANPRVWTNSTKNSGGWGQWQELATRNHVDAAKWDRGNVPASYTLKDLTEGTWGVASGTVAGNLGIPEAVTGSVVVSRANSGSGKTAMFISSTHASETPKVWFNATTNSGPWAPEWSSVTQADAVKQAAVPLTFPRGSSYSDDRPTLTMRIPFKFGAAVKRARLRLRNYDYRSDHGFPGSYRIVGAGIGKHQINDDGSMTGLVPEGETVTQLMSSTSMTGPDEAAGDWVDVDLEANTDYLLSYSFTADDGMVYTRQTGQCFTSRLSSGWNRVGSVTATPSNMAVLAAILDVEVLEDTPIYGYLGDSQTAAISASRPGYDSWAMVHSRLAGAIPTIHGHAGGGLSEWQDPDKPAYGISDGMARFDRFHISMGSNDISGGRPYTGVQEYLTALMKNWRGNTDTFVLHNYLPRTSDNPTDTVRSELNEWVLNDLPGNALYAVDVYGATVDPTTGLMAERWRGSPTDVHMNSAGNARVALTTLGGGSAGAELQKANTALKAEIADRHSDTGLRDLSASVPADMGWETLSGDNGVFAQRVGNVVFLTISGVRNTSGENGYVTLANLPPGMRPNNNQFGNTWRGVRTYLRTSGQLDFQTPSGSSDYWSFSYVTNDTWPSSLPGTPA